MNISPGDVISGLALLVSIGAGFQSFSASKHAEKAEKRAEELTEAAERRRLIDDAILEAHALADDVRLHGGAVVKAKQRATAMQIQSGAHYLSSTQLILQQCEGKRIEAGGTLELAQPVMSGGEAALKDRSLDELRKLLRDLKKARNRVGVLMNETRGLVES